MLPDLGKYADAVLIGLRRIYRFVGWTGCHERGQRTACP